MDFPVSYSFLQAFMIMTEETKKRKRERGRRKTEKKRENNISDQACNLRTQVFLVPTALEKKIFNDSNVLG